MKHPDSRPHPPNNDPAKIYLLPNLMTAGNLLCGFMAILQIFEGTLRREQDAKFWWHNYEMSLYFILGAFIFDMLDGRLARLGGQESAFGREFDSLADIVSFGIAPALLLYKIVLYELHNGYLIAFVYLACGALRLARFNVLSGLPDDNKLKEFKGFPIPAAAGLIASITLFLLQIYEHEKVIGAWKYALAGLMLFLSYMMFSKFTYPSFKTLDLKLHRPLPIFLTVLMLMVLTALYYRYALAILFTGYLLYGFLRPYVPHPWRPEFEDEDVNDPDSTTR